MSNVVKEYLIALKAQIDNPSMKAAEGAVKKLDLGMGTLLKSFSAAAGIYTTAATGLYKFATIAAKQDLALENTAKKLMASKESVRQYQNALDALGASMEDIQLNPELKANFDKLINDGRKLSLSGDYAKGTKEVRSFLFEVTRLKQEISYAMQWAGYYVTKNLIPPFQKGRKSLESLNDVIIKKIPEFTEKIGRIAGRVGQVFSSVGEFFGSVVVRIKDFWMQLPDWAKKAITAGGLIGLLVLGMSNPVTALATVIGTIMLLIDDYVSWQQGKKSVFGELWQWLDKNVKITTEDVVLFVTTSLKALGNFGKWCGNAGREIKQFWIDLNKAFELLSETILKTFEALNKFVDSKAFKGLKAFFPTFGGVVEVLSGKAFQKRSFNPFEDIRNFFKNNEPKEGSYEYAKRESTLARVQDAQEQREIRKQAWLHQQTKAKRKGGSNDYDIIIAEMAEKYNIDPALIKAFIRVESNFNPNAVNPSSGAKGLGQFMPETAKGLGINNPFDPRQNIEGIAKYLRQMYDSGDFKTADELIAAYNQGPNAVKQYGIYNEVKPYINKIKSAYNEYAIPRTPNPMKNYKQLAQSNGISCGQTSIASTINLRTGKKLTDADINAAYGFNLKQALETETGEKWTDKDFNKADWEAIEKSTASGYPVTIGLGGRFTSSNGHIMNILSVNGNEVLLGDPNGGKYEFSSKKEIEEVQGHHEGKFIFIPTQFLQSKNKLDISNFASMGMGMMNNLNAVALDAQKGFNDVSTALAGSNINVTNGNIIINVANSNASPADIASAVSNAYNSMQQREYYELSRALNNAWMG